LEAFKFALPLNVFRAVQCNEVGSVSLVKSPYNVKGLELKGFNNNNNNNNNNNIIIIIIIIKFIGVLLFKPRR
jgi:hypothetical protein